MSLKDTAKLRAIPEDAPLSTSEQWKFWFLANRTKLGSIATMVIGLLRVALIFPHHTEVFDLLTGLTDLLLVGTVSTAVSGATKPDEYHEQEMHATIRQRSGQFPIYQRRANDRMHAKVKVDPARR